MDGNSSKACGCPQKGNSSDLNMQHIYLETAEGVSVSQKLVDLLSERCHQACKSLHKHGCAPLIWGKINYFGKIG